MDCTIVKDKLLDYIDGNLNEEGKNLVKDHLENCGECSDEYKEIKITINYIEENIKKIDLSKEINLKPNKSKNKNKNKNIRRFSRTGLVAVILLLVLVITSNATDIFDFMKWWKKGSEIKITAWENLIENGVGDKLDISVIDNGIRITAESVIADEINTVILLRIEDLEGDIRFEPYFDRYEEEEIKGDGISIEGDIGNHYITQLPMLNYARLYSEEDNTLRLMLITNPITKDIGNIKVNIRKLMDMLNIDKDSKIIREGNWDIEISANKIKSKGIEINEVIDLDGNEIKIKKITLAPTETNIEYQFETFNAKNKYYLNSLSFSIEYNGKIYGQANIGISYNPYVNMIGIANTKESLESLYLEDPSEVTLIVEQYRYANKIITSAGDKRYKIDFKNLPQVIEYNNSKITIEEIIYNEKSVDLIIREDDSKDRKYISTDLNITYDIEGVLTGIYGHYIEYELRDDKGKVAELEDKIINKKTYNYVTRQKIEIEKADYCSKFGIPEDMIDQGVLYILGQRYIEYPNKKITIKLK